MLSYSLSLYHCKYTCHTHNSTYTITRLASAHIPANSWEPDLSLFSLWLWGEPDSRQCHDIIMTNTQKQMRQHRTSQKHRGSGAMPLTQSRHKGVRRARTNKSQTHVLHTKKLAIIPPYLHLKLIWWVGGMTKSTIPDRDRKRARQAYCFN